MTEPQTPWTQRLVARSRRLLLAGVLAAVVTVAASLYLSRGDGRLAYATAEPGATATVAGATFHLDRLYTISALPGAFDTTEAVDGATFVIADLSVDLTGSQGNGCLAYLKAGDYWFASELAYTPSDPDASPLCSAGTDGTVSMAFQVPRRLVGQVDGVRIDIVDGERVARLVLPAAIG
ncbi:hypothetical protein [Propionicimonas sp.]|uniref:hypothetical protein n=1 Tax=Propionicimonas sp. TaxID=1955623 RepID=UPI0039E2F587